MAGEKIAVKYENWIRLVTLIHYVGFEVCKYIVHTVENLPVDGAQLYQVLNGKRADFDKLLRKNVLKQDQYDFIFPGNGVTDIKKFDITLFTFVISVMFGKRKYQQLVEELRKWRNEEFHQGQIEMTKVDFDNKWNAFLQLVGNYGIDPNDFADLRTCALDKQTQVAHRYYLNNYLLLHYLLALTL